MNIGVFGGTFDPIHFGHLAAAKAMRSTLGLAKILFVPTGQPWLKADLPISPQQDRLEMVRLAIADERYFEVSTVEVDRPGPSYTVDTMDMLQRELGSEAKLFFLVGSDALSDLSRWKEPARLIRICRLVAFSRPGAALPSLNQLESAIPGISKNLTFAEVPQLDISATEIRRLVALGASIGHLVPRAVEGHIVEHGLYRNQEL
jgi:nicotinate-nucleotide adenylyltransferase